jgi:hypothetical protein
MSVRSDSTHKGALLSLRITVEARQLEDLLETLAELPYPLNPQIHHHWDHGARTAVEFPAYQSWLGDIRRALGRTFPTPVEIKEQAAV